MKKAPLLSLLLLCTALSSASAQEHAWTWQNPLPQGNTLHATDFVDAQTGWAVGEAGTIVHTTDGGDTWTVQKSGTPRNFSDVHFLDAVTGWAVGRSGTVLHTTDGGAAWTPQDGGLPAFFTDVHFADADHGWISTHERLAAGTSIRVTTDGGTTWNTVTTGATFDLRGVYFVDASTGWIVGVAGEILRTDDGGVTWTPQTDGLRDTFWDVAALNPDTVLVVGPERMPL